RAGVGGSGLFEGGIGFLWRTRLRSSPRCATWSKPSEADTRANPHLVDPEISAGEQALHGVPRQDLLVAIPEVEKDWATLDDDATTGAQHWFGGVEEVQRGVDNRVCPRAAAGESRVQAREASGCFNVRTDPEARRRNEAQTGFAVPGGNAHINRREVQNGVDERRHDIGHPASLA